MKLAPRIVLTVIVVVGLIMSAFGYLVVTSIRADMSEGLTNRLAGDVKFAAVRVKDKVEEISTITQAISKIRDIPRALDTYESRGINQILNDHISLYPFINYILVVEPDGSVFSVSTRDSEGRKTAGEQLLLKQIDEHPMYTAISQGAVAISAVGDDPYLDIIGLQKGYSQWFLADIKKRGHIVGRVVVAIDWANIHAVLLNEVVRELADTGNPIVTAVIKDKDNRLLNFNSLAFNEQQQQLQLGTVYKPSGNIIFASQELISGQMPVDVLIGYDRELAWKPISDKEHFIVAVMFVGSALLGLTRMALT